MDANDILPLLGINPGCEAAKKHENAKLAEFKREQEFFVRVLIELIRS